MSTKLDYIYTCIISIWSEGYFGKENVKDEKEKLGRINELCCICVTYFALSIERTWPDLTYISLLIIFCLIEYVTNKTLNPYE